jgi:hypothetical protein
LLFLGGYEIAKGVMAPIERASVLNTILAGERRDNLLKKCIKGEIAQIVFGSKQLKVYFIKRLFLYAKL